MNDTTLDGMSIAITRPRAQAEPFAQWLVTQGAHVLLYPLLEIEGHTDAMLDATFDRGAVDGADGIIFVSANAAEFGLRAIMARGGMPARATVYAIGDATAARLKAGGTQEVITPSSGSDSEALLALPGFHSVAGKKFLVVRGVSESGGRKTLTETLQARRAVVATLECYERRNLTLSSEARSEFLNAIARHEIHAISVLSVETLDSLVANLDTKAANAGWAPSTGDCMILVPHVRVANAARKLGLTKVEVVPMRGEPLLDALVKLKKKMRPMRVAQ
jgi:uroporphyrinogen-III synthase